MLWRNIQGRKVGDVYVTRWVAILNRANKEVSQRTVTFEQILTVEEQAVRAGVTLLGLYSIYSEL